MAGVTDLPFRQLCLRYGAGLATTEMLTSDTSLWHSRKSTSRLRIDTNKSVPVSMQIAGSEPELLAAAAKQCVELGAQIVDINMGCPAKKVCKKLAGSALLRDEDLVAEILQKTVAAVDVPVTLKTRTGWDTQNKNAVRIARMAEDCGIAALTLHGRTRACRFNGDAEYETIADVVNAVSIPVIANGDITNSEKAKKVLQQTGAQAVMVGRAALGQPWLFRSLNQELAEHFDSANHRKASEQKSPDTHPNSEDIKSVMIEHVQHLHQFYGTHQGVRIARKHVGWYCEHIAEGQTLRTRFNTLEGCDEQIQAIVKHFETIKPYEEEAA